MAPMLLIADIGGTNARFALADARAATPLLDDSVREFAVADFRALRPVPPALSRSVQNASFAG